MILGLKYPTQFPMLFLLSTSCDTTGNTVMVYKANKEALGKIDHNPEKGINFDPLLVHEQRIHASGKHRFARSSEQGVARGCQIKLRLR
jgi:hypothetical protein